MNRLFIAVVAFALVTCLHPSIAMAQLSEISVGIDGLDCATCGATVEKNLQSAPGVAAVRLVSTEGVAHIRLKAGAAFVPDKLQAAIEKGGEKVRGFNLQMCANVDKENGRVFVHAPGAKTQRFAVHGKSQDVASVAPNTLVCLKAKVVSNASPVELDLTELIHP
ncbi:MAG: heavy metal-associated domain-containing protein [Alphaproteobacteria bacterium]